MSQHSISNFLSQFPGGGARANRFKITMTVPTALLGSAIQNKIAFMARASAIPEQIIGVANVPYQGAVVKLAGDRTFNDWTITVINDTSFDLRWAFENWIGLILGNESNTATTVTQSTYFGQGQVVQLGRDNVGQKVLATYNFKDVFPTSVTEIALGWDTNDEVEIFDVTLAVNWWERQGTLPTL